MDAEDRRLFEEALRKVTSSSSGAELDAALVDLGWVEALDEDRSTAVSLLFELQGAANATSASLDVLLAHTLGVDVVAPILLLPRLGSYTVPAQTSDGRLTGRGLARAGDGDLVIVAGDAAESVSRSSAVSALSGLSVFSVPVADSSTRSVSGLDPELGLVALSLDVPVDAAKTLVSSADWPSMVAVGQLAIAHEIVGACRTMLRLAREHALEREQFGRPISQFQAIRHRLAESLVAVESAASALAAAWEDGTPSSARYAKAIAGTSARTVARHAQQVLAGIGYTTEHSFHRYLRRVLVLDQLLGSSKTLTREIGEELLQARAVPPMLPL
jgi:hypothetical protein